MTLGNKKLVVYESLHTMLLQWKQDWVVMFLIFNGIKDHIRFVIMLDYVFF